MNSLHWPSILYSYFEEISLRFWLANFYSFNSDGHMLSYRTSYWKICNRRCNYFSTSAHVSPSVFSWAFRRKSAWGSTVTLPTTQGIFILIECIRIWGETCVVRKGSIVPLHHFGCRQRKGWFSVQIAGREKKPAWSWHMPDWREPLEHVAAFSRKAVVFIKAWIGRTDKWLWSKCLWAFDGIARVEKYFLFCLFSIHYAFFC